MKKLGLLLIACFFFTLVSVAQNNIVKSLGVMYRDKARYPFIRMPALKR